jgi:hypothetical protein
MGFHDVEALPLWIDEHRYFMIFPKDGNVLGFIDPNGFNLLNTLSPLMDSFTKGYFTPDSQGKRDLHHINFAYVCPVQAQGNTAGHLSGSFYPDNKVSEFGHGCSFKKLALSHWGAYMKIVP